MDVINGYTLTTELSSKDAGFSRWAFCIKNGREYYIKEFLDPKYPLDSGELSKSVLEKRRKVCDAIYSNNKRFYDALSSCRTGNIIVVEDYFRFGSRYYAVTDKVTSKKMTDRQVAQLPDEKKIILIRSLLYSFARLHEAGIVHADIKPENILLKGTKNNGVTGKIIDFDSGFLKTEPPEPDDLQGDFLYMAPEALLYIRGKGTKIDEKLDIFALGLLFHLYWTGELPAIEKKYHYAFEAVLDGSPIEVKRAIPEPLRSLIVKMLKKTPEERPTAAQALQILSAMDQKKRENRAEEKVKEPKKEMEHGFYIPTDLD